MVVGEWGAVLPPPSHGMDGREGQSTGAQAGAQPVGHLLGDDEKGWGIEGRLRKIMAHLGLVSQAIASVNPDVSSCMVSMLSQLRGGA